MIYKPHDEGKMRLPFQVESTTPGSRARAGRLTTLHGEIRTPVFMPVGTFATVRGLNFETLENIGSQIMLSNTYHLLLRPGKEVMKHVGGVHKFMNWSKPVLTDSGGFQIFCLPNDRQISEEGAKFRSYVNGDLFMLTPELSIEMQKTIGSDIMMVLDECIPSTAERAHAESAVERTFRWAQRSLAARGNSPQSLFGIVQGTCFPDLRKRSAEQITSLAFDGFAIGGLAVGETRQEREDTTAFTTELLPKDRPRYLMGVGTPIDLLEAVHRGVDMFDCILPNAMGQQGVVYTWQGKLDLRRGIYKFSDDPLDPQCILPGFRTHSRAYWHHLVKSRENFGAQYLGAHNIYFYHQLMKRMREEILAGTFEAFYQKYRSILDAPDEQNMPSPPKAKKRKLPPLELGQFEVLVNASKDFASIKDKLSGETMHSVNNPDEEAERLYIEGSGLMEKFQSNPGGKITIWDVGLGAAHNSTAALRCHDKYVESQTHFNPEQICKLEIVSFESNLDALKLVCLNPKYFKHIRRSGPQAILDQSEWSAPFVEWKLFLGNYFDFYKSASKPDIIFYDPFSFKTAPHFWTEQTFKDLFAVVGNKSCTLHTYSASTVIRNALKNAGFVVDKGPPSGPKESTTIARCI